MLLWKMTFFTEEDIKTSTCDQCIPTGWLLSATACRTSWSVKRGREQTVLTHIVERGCARTCARACAHFLGTDCESRAAGDGSLSRFADSGLVSSGRVSQTPLAASSFQTGGLPGRQAPCVSQSWRPCTVCSSGSRRASGSHPPPPPASGTARVARAPLHPTCTREKGSLITFPRAKQSLCLLLLRFPAPSPTPPGA